MAPISAAGSEAPVVHPPRLVRAALLGYGQVGQAVANLAASPGPRTRLRAAGVELIWTGALVRDPARERNGPAIPLHTAGASLLAEPFDVAIEVLGGIEPARSHILAALHAGVPVVTANKSLLAACGAELRAVAARHGTWIACDAAVLAGVPFLGSLARRPLISSARRLEGILNGTTHFILTTMERGASFEAALAEAQRLGYAEPDSRADISGRDAAEKLCVLLQIAGCGGIRPAGLTTLGLDSVSAADLAGARALGGTLKPVGMTSLDPADSGAWVGPAFVPAAHAFARLTGVTNALSLTSAAGDTVSFSGPGAGPIVTATTILDDLAEALARGTRAPEELDAFDVIAPAAVSQPSSGAWWLAVAPGPGPVPSAIASTIAERLSASHLPALHLATVADRVYARTSAASWATVSAAATALRTDGYAVTVLPTLSSD